MFGAEPRLGDLIDDHCPRCRLLLNHAIASLVDGHVVKVICQTCYSEHAYQRGQGGKKKTGPRATLFDQVLAKVSSTEEDSESAATKKKPAEPARYVSRRKGKSSRSKS